MNKDLVYIYDKTSPYRSSILGEVQKNFNMSFVIDGTKDSCQIDVWSYYDSEIEPYTILWHEKTNTWWIVSHDKIERYLSENGFIYVHTLKLLGAIELMNARDLTDCGFNQETYTIGEFINRLFALSTFEFAFDVIYAPTNFLNKKVGFVKTFENYTILSALREFLDAYNMSVKLGFFQSLDDDDYLLQDCYLQIIPKTGNTSVAPISIDTFDDVRETKTIDKNSFGTCVVSNAENVISSKDKTYPSTGSVRASSDTFRILAQNGVIRLPSKVFKGNWIKIIGTKAPVYISGNVGATLIAEENLGINVMSNGSFDMAIQRIKDIVYSASYTEHPDNPEIFYDPFVSDFEQNMQTFKDGVTKMATITLYNGNVVNPSTQEIEKGENVPYLAHVNFIGHGSTGNNRPFIFCDKDFKNTLPREWQGIAWERGSNLITGFDGFESVVQGTRGQININNLINTDLQVNGTYYVFYTFTNTYGTVTLATELAGFDYVIHFIGDRNNLVGGAQFIINYTPMSDVKIKVDNQRTKKDIHLYNQNGKLTDNFALSKLINSYSKEISSDTITRFKQYRNFNEVPKIGTLVAIGSDNYVINNISLDFTQNENTNDDFGYFIESEITMSKYVSTKSMMVNPNTNIRDYGIPQNFNVKRKQLYRDYYELNYASASDREWNYYLNPQNIVNFGLYPNESINFVCVMKCDYDIEVNGQTSWYFQLETTNYDMNKMLYVICDFNDNNIIGYASQNVYSGFVISRVFSGQTDGLNTPISYTDMNGQVKGIDLLFLTNEELTTVYDEYEEEHDSESGYSTWKDSGGTLYNYSCFIPSDIYTKAINEGEYEIRLNEPNYEKDAIEVPVFEYACQIDDSDDVLIGDNILSQHGNCIYMYSYEVGDNLTQDTAITSKSINDLLTDTLTLLGAVDIHFSHYVSLETPSLNYSFLTIEFYTAQRFDTTQNANSFFQQLNVQTGHDIAIFRHSYNLETHKQTKELMFICKNVTSDKLFDTRTLRLQANHYKLN
jgi:hypothetical protein